MRALAMYLYKAIITAMRSAFIDAADSIVIVYSLGLQPMRRAGSLDHHNHELCVRRRRQQHCHRALALTAAIAPRELAYHHSHELCFQRCRQWHCHRTLVLTAANALRRRV